jgi:hypothetical protein
MAGTPYPLEPPSRLRVSTRIRGADGPLEGGEQRPPAGHVAPRRHDVPATRVHLSALGPVGAQHVAGRAAGCRRSDRIEPDPPSDTDRRQAHRRGLHPCHHATLFVTGLKP